MAGRGPAPKPDSTRRRRNRATTAAVLPSEREMREATRGRRLPKLPPRPDGRAWDKRTTDWWRETMRSPMAAQYLDADLHGLAMAFELIDEFYEQLDEERGTKGRIGRIVMLASEVRQAIARYGLTPRDRLSLHWAVAEDEAAPEPGAPRPSNVSSFRDALGAEEPA